MIDPESLDELRDAIRTQVAGDSILLDRLRQEIRSMRSATRRVQPRGTTSISLVGTDGGNNQLQFDPFLLQRDQESRSKVSNLLNATDGFLSDQLRLHIIATVNCPLSHLDPAVIRPGRLIGYREFRSLTRAEAEALATAVGLELADAPDHSLAEVYSAAAPAEPSDSPQS
jgi:hypothetical protein